MEKFLLIDGNSLLFRAYYATAFTRMLQTSYGKYTNAVVAFNNMMTNVIKDIQPDHILVAFDTKDKTFRHEMFDDYKGHRSKAPEELVEQFETVREMIDAAGIKRLEISGYEADDIIGSFSKQHTEMEMIILTSDQDMLQLVDDNTTLLLMKKGVSDIHKITLDNFETEYDIRPDQVIDLKAMMGDSADNIPGIPGIGKVTGLKLIKKYDTLENLLANTDELKGKQKENVENNIEIAKMSKALATIKTDLELDLEPNEFALNIDYQNLYVFYKQYEMNRQANEISENIYEDIEIESFKFDTVQKISETLLTDGNIVFAKTKGSYQDAILEHLIISDGKTVEMIDKDNLLKDPVLLDYLKSSVSKVVYDAKYLYHLFKREDIEFNGVSEDLMIAAFLCDNSLTDWPAFNAKYGGVVLDIDSDDVDLEQLAQNTSELLKTKEEIVKEIKEKEMEYLYYDVELPLAKILFEMELTGIRVSREIIVDIATKTKAIIDDVTQEIYTVANKEFNINSPKQLAEVLFDDLGLPQIKKRSTAIDVLEKLEGQHDVIGLIMKQRKYQKLYSTYADGLQKFIQDDERIHTIYHQTTTQTGRLSSTDPNLQNISVRDEEAREIRKAFLADEGSVLMAYDYSQIELRLLAHLADVTQLIEAFNHSIDIHSQTAKDVFHLDEVTPHDRSLAKAVNFGIIYGISDFGLSEQLGISRHEAKDYIDRYLATYPEIKQYMDDVIAGCEELGYVKTIINRRREIPEIKSSNFMVRSFGKRAAMNAPIQGSAADLIKIAMVRIDKRIKDNNLKSKMLLQVHDELIFNVIESEIDIMKEIIEEEMNQAMDIKVPLISEGSMAKDWYSL